MKARKPYRFHYSLLNADGEVVDSSHGGEPLFLAEDDPALIDGLRAALAGHTAGEEFEVRVPPESAYGHHQRALVRTVAFEQFELKREELAPGMVFQVGSGENTEVVKVVGVESEGVVVDGNHPLAGLALHFRVHVLEVTENPAE